MNPTPYDPKMFNPVSFSQLPYARRIEKPWGWELHWTPDDLPYMGKIIHIKKGCRWSLQAHEKKQESWLLLSGQAKVVWENEQNELTETHLKSGHGYTCALGQRHRMVAVTDCDILEVSTPEIGTTWRLEDDYSRPDETEELRAQDRHVS